MLGDDHARAVARFQELGIGPSYAVLLPADANGVYTAQRFPNDARQERVMHLDQYTGESIIGVGYAKFGAAARLTEWGISVHAGQPKAPARDAMRLTAMVVGAVTLVGCANPNLVGLRGDRPDERYSLQDRRAAKQHVRVVDTLPTDARSMGDFTVQRCDQYLQSESPSDATLRDDLVLLAFAEGADGITDIRFTRESGLLKNCWSVAKGTAQFFGLGKP